VYFFCGVSPAETPGWERTCSAREEVAMLSSTAAPPGGEEKGRFQIVVEHCWLHDHFALF